MCAKCVDVVKEVFPDVPDEEIGSFLMNCTAFPFVDPEVIDKQLRELRARTDNYKQCYGLVEADMEREMKLSTEEIE